MKLDKVRSGFPFLKRKFKGKPLAYLDNASTTQKPKVVIDAIVDVYVNHYANIHRGVYDLSIEATQLYEGVRENVKNLIGAKGEFEVVFTKNTTESLNLLAYSLETFFKDNDEILLSEMEHHSNIVPWQLVAGRLKTNAKRRITIKYIPITEGGMLDLSTLDKLVNKRTKVVSITLMSNVLGTINPIAQIAKIVKDISPECILIVDAAQAVGHIKIDITSFGCDALVFSAHKMYGPAGVGVLVAEKSLLENLPPFMGGGDMILSVDFDKTTFAEVPYKFEAGTPSIADVIAFGRAIKFIEQFGYEQISKHEMELTEYALERLLEIPQITIYGPQPYSSNRRREVTSNNIIVSKESSHFVRTINRGGVISFNLGPSINRAFLRINSGRSGVHPHDVASILSDEGVAIRSGHHCAQPLMKVLGIDAACRVSFGIYNTFDEIDRFIVGIEKVQQVFGRGSENSEYSEGRKIRKSDKSENLAL